MSERRIRCIKCDKVFEEGTDLQKMHEGECIGFEYEKEQRENDITLGEIIKDENNNKVTISPTQTDIQKLRPICFYDDMFYIQVNIPVIKIKVNQKGVEEKERTHETYYVTSNRELLHHTDEKLSDFQMPKLVINNDFERWAYCDIVSYCSDESSLDLVELYNSTEGLFRKYIDLQKDEYYTLVTLWTIGTYVSRLFSYYPYLDLFGTKGSAKSKLLSLFEKMAFNGKLVSSITTATLIRLVESCGYTLLIDETEALKNPKHDKNEFLLQLLKTSYRMSSTVPINVPSKEGWTPQFFDSGTCISLAHINEIDNVLEDRTIPITMEITLKKNIGNSDPDTDINESEWKIQRARFYEFALEYAHEIHDLAKQKIDHDIISNRELNQIWKPIISLANIFQNNGVPDLIRKINLLITETHTRKISSNTEDNPDIQLLDLLVKNILNTKTLSRDDKNEILQNEIFTRFDTFEKLDWLTSSKALGSGLKRLGFESRKSENGKKIRITDQILAKTAKRFSIEYDELKNISLEGVL